MRNLLLALLVLSFTWCSTVYAQNKTLGVGVAAPNPNAALHVESPTGNQGFLMPRLTSEQREQMTSLLTEADKGLMLYDSDQASIFVWNGTSWASSSEFSIVNPDDTNDAFRASTAGSGSAGKFEVNNNASFSHAMYALSNGDSTGSAVYGRNVGDGFGVFGHASGSKFASAAVYGFHDGTGDAAGAFRISNASNGYAALYGETNGFGPAVYGNQLGMGRGSQFQIGNAENTQAALRAYTSGLGNAGFFTVENPTSDSSSIYATSNGMGATITALSTGSGVALMAKTSTGFSAIQGHATGGFSNGVSGISASPEPGSYAILGSNSGAGPAGVFHISNATNASHALQSMTMGTGSAGTFENDNATNDAPALSASTNGTGPALSVTQSNNGLAISMVNGGLKYSVASISASTPTALTEVAGLYKLSATTQGVTFSLPTSVPEGTVCKVFNAGGAADFNIDPVYVEGDTPSPVFVMRGMVYDFIFIDGKWYAN